MKQLLSLSFCLLLVAALFSSCRKDYSYEGGDGIVNTGGGGSGSGSGNPQSNSNTPGWQCNNNGAQMKGCIDTAFYTNLQQIKSLTIRCIDSTGASMQFIITDSVNIKTGTYTDSTGALLTYNTVAGNIYATGLPGTSITFTITQLNDTLVKADFKATLKTLAGSQTAVFTQGTLVAKIGKPNGCGFTAGNNGGGGGNPLTGTWSFKKGTTMYDGSCTALLAPNPLTGGSILTITGPNQANTEAINILIQLSGNTITTGNYSIGLQSPLTSFTYLNATSTGVVFQSNTTTLTQGALMIYNISSYNTTTKVVTGSFNGTALDANNSKVFITNGTFSAPVL